MSSPPAIRKIPLVFLCLTAGISFAREVPNVDPYVDGTDAVSMDALSRTEQKLGYFGDVDALRRKLRECVPIDMGNGVILGGSGCETPPGGSGESGTGGTYSRLQEIVQGTECGQNHAWEVFAQHVGGTNAKAGKVNCSSLAASYCSALNKGKAATNLETYYTCTKNGVLVPCLDIAKEYCDVLHPEEETSGESSGGTTDENVSPAVVGDLTEKEADKIVSEAKTNRCTVNGEEVACSTLAEANAIRSKLGNNSNFNQSISECSADIKCRDANGAIVSCVTARDVIQCSKTSEEAPSLGYSCKVSDEEVDCSILGEGRCTQEVCSRMCPDYGGKVIDNACYCNPEPVCNGVNQTGLNQCPLGGTPAKNGTMSCYCFSEAMCSGSEQYYYNDGDRVLLHKGDQSFCTYGGVCAGQQNNPLYECAVEICPYGSNLIKDGKKVFDGHLCPYGYEGQ